HAVVVLPPPPARILTRELLYTGVTRAKERLTLVASEDSIRAAVGRPVARASGLADRFGSANRLDSQPTPASSGDAPGSTDEWQCGVRPVACSCPSDDK